MSALPRVHVVTDDRILARPGFLQAARAVMAAGGGALAFHVRGPHTGGRILHDLAHGLLADRDRHGCLLLVNDRVDLALVLGLDGVHLGRRSLPVDVARKLLPAASLVGLSVHAPGEAGEVPAPGADYLFVGAVYDTPSHPERPRAGLDLVRGTRRVTPLPLVAIGGMEAALVAGVLGAGAHGVAAIRAVWDAPDPPSAVAALIEAVRRAAPGETREEGEGE